MQPRFTEILASLLAILILDIDVHAQDPNDILVQAMDNQVVTGAPDAGGGTWSIGQRVFFYEFGDTVEHPDPWVIRNPGFNAFSATSPSLPSGADPLPGNEPLQWDFLPMDIDDASSNLFYWDGLDGPDAGSSVTEDDVAFGLEGSFLDYTLTIATEFGSAAADGTGSLITGSTIDETAANGNLHKHPFYELEDNDGDGGTEPVDGIYLISLRLRIAELAPSEPTFVVFGTADSSVDALDAAVLWVTDRVDTLVVPGDYNGDGKVSAADYTMWQDSYGSTTDLRADGRSSTYGVPDGLVDEFDYQFWKDHYGDTLGSGSGTGQSLAAVTEPASILLALVVLPVITPTVRRCFVSSVLKR